MSLLLLPFTLLRVLAPAPAPPAPPAPVSLTVVVTALASTHSAVKLNFYNTAASFLQDSQQARQLVVRPGGKTTLTVPVELAPGEWAVALTQDVNDNDLLDTNFLGIPTEPYAFSNNVRPRFSRPTFAQCKFVVSQPGQVITIALQKQ